MDFTSKGFLLASLLAILAFASGLTYLVIDRTAGHKAQPAASPSSVTSLLNSEKQALQAFLDNGTIPSTSHTSGTSLVPPPPPIIPGRFSY